MIGHAERIATGTNARPHPSWCPRQHVDAWPVHSARVGPDVALSRDLTYGVNVSQTRGERPVVELLRRERQADGVMVTMTNLTPDFARALDDLLRRALELIESEPTP